MVIPRECVERRQESLAGRRAARICGAGQITRRRVHERVAALGNIVQGAQIGLSGFGVPYDCCRACPCECNRGMILNEILWMAQDFLSTVVDYPWMRSCAIAIAFLCILACIVLDPREEIKRSLSIIGCIIAFGLSTIDEFPSFLATARLLPVSVTIEYLVVFLIMMPTNLILVVVGVSLAFRRITGRVLATSCATILVHYPLLLFFYEMDHLPH